MNLLDETWRTRREDEIGKTACAVYSQDGKMIADLRLSYQPEIERKRATLMAAAKELALALMALGWKDCTGEWHLEQCHEIAHEERCENARQALKKAGVL